MIYNEANLTTLVRVVEAIDHLGGYVNDTCGLHVHVDASFIEEMTERQQKAFFKHIRKEYAKYENAFDSRMDRTRTEDRNHYCRSMKWAGVDNGSINYDQNRYVKLNTCSYVQHGTIEFRQHHGTIDAEEIIEWVKTCLVFIEHARQTFSEAERELWAAHA